MPMEGGVRPELSNLNNRRVRFEEDVPARKRVVGLTRKFQEENKRKRLAQNVAYRPPSILRNKPHKPTVLHGRVLYEFGQQNGAPRRMPLDEEDPYDAPSVTNDSVRQNLQRKSTFYKLSEEVQSFQQVVAKLEAIVRKKSQVPEASWRIRNLMLAARAQDKQLYQGIYTYERTLRNHTNDTRQAQTAVLKLHLDFKRAHRSLLMSLSNLSEFASEEEADWSLSSVGWTGLSAQDNTAANNTEETKQQPAERENSHPTPEIVVTRKLRPKSSTLLHHELDELVQHPREEEDIDCEFVAADVQDSVMSPASDDATSIYEPPKLCGCMEKQDDEPSIVRMSSSQDDNSEFTYSPSWMNKLERNVFVMQASMQRMTDRLGCGAAPPRRRRVPRMASF